MTGIHIHEDRLQQLSAATLTLQGIVADLTPADVDDAQLLERARRHFRLRRLRDQVLPLALFADPAWDILLDLYIAMRCGKRLTVSGLGSIAGIAQTTALRYMKLLVHYGLIVRRECPRDGRRIFIDLTDDAVAKLAAILGANSGVQGRPGIAIPPE